MSAATAGVVGASKREIAFIGAVALTVFWLLPLALLAMNAAKTPEEFLLTSGLAPPTTFNLFDNIARAWGKGLSSGFFNSLIYGAFGSVGAVLISALAAYGIVRLRIPRGLFWFLLIYSGTVFPFQMYLIPLFNLYLDTGMYDSRFGMIAFYIAICIPFCTFVMRGFFLTVPWQLQEAAALDGASSWRTFWSVMMPLARAPLILLILIQFTWIWNDLLFGLVLTKSTDVRPIMVALAGMKGVYGATDGPSVIAATLIGTAPTLLLFLALQRYFVRGLTLGLRAMTGEGEFSGKVALVTGGAMGIGEAVAEVLAERGARVAIVDRDREASDKVVARLTGRGFAARSFPTDVAVGSEVAASVVGIVEAFGGIDIVSNNAGIQRYGTVETTTEAAWDEVINVNLRSVYLVCHHAIPHLRKRRGAIVNMASVQSFATQKGVAAYTTGKHALIGLTRSMALDFAGYGVRVNAVAPGSVDTPMLRWAVSLDDKPEALMRVVEKMHPLGRIAEAREVAEAVAFLASPRASFVTGATLVVDGGLLLPLSGTPAEE